MSLACALRLPLEKIRVNNITLTDARGIRTVIDAARFFLSSNGTVRCYVIGTIGAGNATPAASAGAVSGSDGRASLRRLQAAAGSSQAEVDYYIVEPPTEVLALTSSEFSSVVQSSSAMADLSASVGSTGVLALSESSMMSSSSAQIAAGGASNAPTSGSGSGSSAGSAVSNSAVIGAAVGAVAMAALVVAGAVGFSQARKRARSKSNITRSGSVHVVQHTVNPIGGSPARTSPTQLHLFSVGSLRGPMAFEAVKTRTGV